MKKTKLLIIISAIMSISLFACSKTDIEQAKVMDKNANQAIKKNMGTFSEECPRTETATLTFGSTTAGCPVGSNYTNSYSYGVLSHEVSRDCNGDNEITRDVPYQTVYTTPCNGPSTTPRYAMILTAFIPQDVPSYLNYFFTGVPFTLANFEYANNTYLSANPTILASLREVWERPDIVNESYNINSDCNPIKQDVRDRVYMAMIGYYLAREIGTQNAINLATNFTVQSVFGSGSGTPNANLLRQCLASNMGGNLGDTVAEVREALEYQACNGPL